MLFALLFSVAPAIAQTSAPVVNSFTYVQGTNYFQLQFSEPVTGVDIADFTFATTGSLSADTYSVAAVDPSTYRVAFNYTGGTGSLAVSIKSSGTGIVGSTSGQAYAGGGVTMAVVPATSGDSTAPTVTSFVAGTPSGDKVNFTITFSEGVYDVRASNFSVNATGTAAGVVGTAIAPTNTAGTVYTIPVTFTGTGTLSLTAAGGTIKDGSNNLYVGPNTSTVASVTSSGGGDTTAPSVSSFTVGASTATSVTFNLTFSESVTGVDASDFTIGGTGSAGASLGTVSGSGASYTIPVNFTASSGTIQLTIDSSGTGIVDAASNPLSASGLASASFTIPSAGGDTAAPVITNFWFDVGAVQFVVEFNEAVTGVDASDFAFTTQGTGVTASVTSVTPVSSTTYRVSFNYTDPAAVPSTGGSLQLGIKTSGTGIVDSSANAFAGGGVAASDPVPYLGKEPTDYAAPTVSSFSGSLSGSTVTFTLTFSEPVSGVDAADFLVSRTGSATATLGTISGGVASYTIPVTVGGTGTVQLTVVGGATANIRDVATNWFRGGDNAMSTAVDVSSGGTAPSITSATSASATAGSPFTYTITATGTPTSFAASNLSGTGLSLNSATGVISGTPSTAGTITTQLTATNSVGTSAPVTLTISVGMAGSAPSITSSNSASGAVGSAFSYQITATGSPTMYAATNLSGTGLSLNTSTGLISGTPTAAGTITSQLTASNSYGTSAPVTLTISIGAAGAVPTITSSGTASAMVGSPFSYQIAASGSPTSYAATNLSGTGLTLNSATGYISGTPTATGTITSSLTATNSTGTSAAKTLTITVSPAAGAVPSITSAASASAMVGTPFSYTITATNSPTSYAATNLAGTGLTLNSATGVISGTPLASGTITSQLTASNSIGTSAPQTLTITVGSTPGAAPIVQTQTVNRFLNNAMTYKVLALNDPTSWTLTGQPPGVTIDPVTGIISGTPTAAGAFAATVTAMNSAGSDKATIVFNIVPAIPTVRRAQRLEFVPPVSAIIVNTPVALGATAPDSGLPITYSIVSGNATIAGNVLTIRDSNPVIVRASQAGNSVWSPMNVDRIFTAQRAAQQIQVDHQVSQALANEKITLTAKSTSGLPVTYTLISGPAVLSGNTLTLTGASGTVLVRVSQAGNDAFTGANPVTLTFNVSAVGQQIYLGKLGADDVLIAISQDNTRGVLVTRISSTGEGLFARFSISNGMFTAQARSTLPNATSQNRTVTGTVANGAVNGTISGLGAFTATVQAAAGPLANYAGLYTAMMPGMASGDTYVFVTPAGQAYAFVITPRSVASGIGTVSTAGVLNVTTSGDGTISGIVDPSKSAITGSFARAGLTSRFAGISAAATGNDRMINISSRLRVTGNDTARASIVGFVITGTTPKQMLIRAVGPTLSAFGLGQTLADPGLRLYDSKGALVASNSGWNNDAQVNAAGDKVGAFRLGTGSKDAALLVTLQPGAYTAQVLSNNNGRVLIEVYDVAANDAVPTKQLVNISTRGFVGTGDDVLVAGFVVTGNQPKRVLIRGVGPSLAAFGVSGVLTNPVLKVYDAAQTVVAQNDDWATAQPLNTAQVVATAAELTAAATASGAFPLTSGSADAAVIVTLNPGAYTAIVSGANNSTGAAMVEVYEIPNP